MLVHGVVLLRGQEVALPLPRQVTALPACLNPKDWGAYVATAVRAKGGFTGHEGGKRCIGARNRLALTRLPGGLKAVLKTRWVGLFFLLLTSPGRVGTLFSAWSPSLPALHALPGAGGFLVLPLPPTRFASLAEPSWRLSGISVTEEIRNCFI